MTEYNPDSFVVLKMTKKDQTFYKVLGGWAGGYLNGDSWRLNSGIEKCEYDVDNDKWRFHGSSGSVYAVNPESYGIRMATTNVWEQMKTMYPDQVEMMPDCDWSKFNFGGVNV